MNNQKNYYFVGIKGTGMAALARVLNELGNHVEGSDIAKETFTQAPLEKAGIKIHEFDPANLRPGMIVVQGNAFGDDHPEIVHAKELGLTIQTYPETVEQVIESNTSIGIAGAHGKTSTTGLLSHVLSNVEPTSFLIGDGVGHGDPDSRFFVFEADEYRDHFLAYHPDYAIMTNIDFDHPDYFKDIDDVRSSFEQYGQQVKKAIFAWGDDPNLRKLSVDVPVYYYGTNSQDDFRAENIQRTPAGSTYDAYYHDQKLGTFTIHLYGEHSVLNSLAVIAVAYMEHVDLEAIQHELSNFTGVKRRFSESKFGDMTVIDDYAHHPSEINATIDAARQKYPDKELVVVFQPHTYSRLQAYLKQFGQALGKADKTYVTPIFGSIRENAGHVSSADLEQLVPGSEDIDLDSMDKLLAYHNDVVVFMGAGDIEKYEDQYARLLKK
ncbi:UDP-N-acetylmuramate--L-alanine ligase [uncultured Limosilactobacillus sp.]|uniref:UDP-N-acetylmuramate--L-alanine ligase n=1 Tax=uncultured Limosilactobacillus sp. TaxID=2837629 RepID=UPI0025DBDEB6|nr:UDP-N-acetylmuramate--L-alanine ligase [uncultured Limosilactobacillus sp.]